MQREVCRAGGTTIASMFLAAMLVGPAAAAVCPVSCTTPNTTTGLEPVTVDLGHTRFINYGLQGVGRISASFRPAADEDTYGSISGMAITDWQRNGDVYSGVLYTLPDRGYNDPAQGFFSDYAARIYRFDFTFTPYTDPAPVAPQNQITLTYAGRTNFTYQTTENGVTVSKLTTGLDPATNTTTLFGQTVPFVPQQAVGGVNYPVNSLTLDSEALVLKPDGSGYIGDEYGPNVYYFNSQKQIVGVLVLPESVRPHKPEGTLNFESVDPPVNGRRNNQGMEGVSLSPDGKTLYTLLQSATVQDTDGAQQQTRLNTRLLAFSVGEPDVNGMPQHSLIGEYALQLPIFTRNGNGAAPNRTAAQSEILSLGDGRLLVLSRDGNGLGSNEAAPAVFKSILLIDIQGATNFAGDSAVNQEGGQISPGGVLLPTITPVSWVEALNMLNTEQLAKFGFNTNNADVNRFTLSEKWEALSLQSVLDPAYPDDYFLFIGNDNDFLTTQGFMRQANGEFLEYNASVGFNPRRYADNDTVLLAYRVSIRSIDEPGAISWLALGLGWLGWYAWREQRRVNG